MMLATLMMASTDIFARCSETNIQHSRFYNIASLNLNGPLAHTGPRVPMDAPVKSVSENSRKLSERLFLALHSRIYSRYYLVKAAKIYPASKMILMGRYAWTK